MWTPDGKHVIFKSESPGLNTIKTKLEPYSLSPDGRNLAYSSFSPDTGYDLRTLALDLSDPDHPKASKPELFLHSREVTRDPAFSPDGRWLAYQSQDAGLPEVYVRLFHEPGGKWQISTGGGRFPRWSRTGHVLYYETLEGEGNRIMEAGYTSTSDSFSASKPHLAANVKTVDASADVNWDVAPDGKNFVIFPLLDQAGEKGSVHVTFLLNFFDELRRRVPMTGK